MTPEQKQAEAKRKHDEEAAAAKEAQLKTDQESARKASEEAANKQNQDAARTDPNRPAPLSPTVTAQAGVGGVTWALKTPDEIIRDINDAITADLPDAVAAQHDETDRKMAELNAANEEGMQKLLDIEEAKAAEAHARTAHAGDVRANHVPTGKEDNHNTPKVMPDGSKVWP